MKRLVFAVLFITLSFVAVYALPFSSEIKDASGDYVWYQDATFARTSYVGFLCYDDTTFQLRYFAPRTKKEAEFSVALYVTLDATKDYIDLTGERILGAHTKDDPEIVNYLHDIFYELGKVRSRAAAFTPAAKNSIEKVLKSNEDIAQFGGNVDVFYSNLIPFFNIRCIEDNKGNKNFQIITAGRLMGDADKSFDEFKGLLDKSTGKRKFSPDKKAQPMDFESGNQAVSLTSEWVGVAQNSFACGNAANIMCARVQGDFDAKLLRRFLQSTDGDYRDWQSLSIKHSEEVGDIISSMVFDKSGTMHTLMKIKAGGDNSFYYFSMSVYNDIYLRNKKYFDKVGDSYFIADVGF